MREQPRHHLGIWSDPWLLLCSLMLAMLGVVMIYSTTHQMAIDANRDAYFFLKKHLGSLFLGLIALYTMSRFPLLWLRRLALPLLGLSFTLLAMVHVPGMGVKAGGAIRWLKIAGVRIGQPSELAKLAMILYLASSLARKEGRIHLFKVGFLPHVMVMGVVLVLLMAQPDFGTSMMLSTLLGIMLFVAGVPLRFLFGSAMLALPAVYLMLIRSSYRWKRITAFLDPFHPENIQDSAFQLVQSLKAFASGALSGLGLGNGQQKLGQLPEAHTDFIFAILGEELGLLGVLFTLTLFLFLLYRGFRIATRSQDLFARYLALGLTAMIGLQALINVGVVTGALPTKGMPLPFISFARTSLIVVLAAVGLLLRVEAHTLETYFRAYRAQQPTAVQKGTKNRSKSKASSREKQSHKNRPAASSRQSRAKA